MRFLTTLAALLPIFIFPVDGDFAPVKPTSFPYTPWFTGPLLAPTPVNMQPGHPAIEPSITLFKTYGEYDSDWNFQKQTPVWAINPFIDFQFGITDYLGIEILASAISNFRHHQTSTHLQDTIVLFGYQVSNDTPGSWIPDFRLILQETFPTGKYQKLDPKKHGIDATGQGSFQTGPLFAFQKSFSLFKHPCSLRWSFAYIFPALTKVKGLNAYGGESDTRGKVRPGETLIIFFSGEYSLTQNWALAFDTEFFHQQKSHFSGKKGTTPTGTHPQTELPASTQISFAPEVEYNFSPNSGVLLGAWFTLAGKNSDAFGSIFAAYLYVF